MSSIPTTVQGSSQGNKRVQRRFSRRRIETLVYAGFGPDNGGFPINLSEDGLAFQGIRPLQKDQTIETKFKLPGMRDSVEAAGHVVWVNGLGKGGGLRFVDLTDQSRYLIQAWLSGGNQPTFGLDKIAAIPPTPSGPEKVPPPEINHSAALRIDTSSDAVVPIALKSMPNSDVSSVPELNVSATSFSTLGLLVPANATSVPEKPPSSSETAGKRNWIAPLALTSIVSGALLVLAGVNPLNSSRDFIRNLMNENSIQRVDGSGQAVAPPLSMGTEIANDNFSGDGKIADQTSLPVPPAVSNDSMPEQTVAPQQVAPDPPMEIPAAKAKIVSTGTSHEPMAVFAKALAPRPLPAAQTPDVPPPALPLFINSSPVPPLSKVFSTMPAPSVVEPAGQSSKVVAAQLVEKKNPAYPAWAKQSGLSGSVELRFLIKPDGTVRNVKVINGNPILGNAAAKAIRSWRYIPAQRDGVPVETESSTIINFDLR